jgi:hypothetical protein
MENNLIGCKVNAITNRDGRLVEVTILDKNLVGNSNSNSYHEYIGMDEYQIVHTFSPSNIKSIIKLK